MKDKIVSMQDIATKKTKWTKKKSVLVGGCFDILHFGHLTFLQSAREEGDLLIVMLESDESIKAYKKREPVHTQEQRAQVLSALQFVDYIIPIPHLNDSRQYLDLVQQISPQIIAITEGDPRAQLKVGQASLVGAEVKAVCPNLTNFSTTKIIEYASIFSD